MTDPKPSILFITANRLGDAILATGVLQRLLTDHPGARVTIICGPHAAGLFRAVPGLERLIILRKQKWNRHWLEAWQATRGQRWDIILDLRNSIITRLLRAGRTYYVTKLPEQHKVMELATALRLNDDLPPAPHLWLDTDAREAANLLIPNGAPILALAPAANWPCKQWPAARFAELAQKLTAMDGPLPQARVMILASEGERAAIAPVLAAIPTDRRIDVIGQDLLTVAACMEKAALFIGNDSGLMHMAAAMNVPTLGLFGPGYEQIYGPWGPHAGFVRTPEKREDLLARLPHPGAHEPNLMQGLLVATVIKAARDLLRRVEHVAGKQAS